VHASGWPVRAWVGALAALAVTAACSSEPAVDAIGGATTSTTLVEGTTTTGAAEPAATSATAVTTTTMAIPRSGSFESLETGSTYGTDHLGMSVSFSVPQGMLVLHNQPGQVGLRTGCGGPELAPTLGCHAVLALRRLAGWTPPVTDPYDIRSWIEANESVILVDSTDTTIAGRRAEVVDVTLDPGATGEDRDGCKEWFTPCVGFGFTVPRGEPGSEWLSPAILTRFYILEVDGFEPIVIEVAAAPDSDWFDAVEATFLPSLVLGPDGPPSDG
jgi:hypothetical protein